jgi:hypothetical protein
MVPYGASGTDVVDVESVPFRSSDLGAGAARDRVRRGPQGLH